MCADPAFLFYSSDFLTGTTLMSNEQVGKYIRLMCLQHQTGHLAEKHMLNICKTYDEDIFCKFKKDGDGKYYNERLENEIIKRENYSKSRRANRLSRVEGGKDTGDICQTHVDTYVEHMENENINTNNHSNSNKRNVIRGSKFTPPTLDEIRSYCQDERHNTVDAKRFFDYFSASNWVDSEGKPVKSWKQKVITWETNGRKSKPEQSSNPFLDLLREEQLG